MNLRAWLLWALRDQAGRVGGEDNGAGAGDGGAAAVAALEPTGQGAQAAANDPLASSTRGQGTTDPAAPWWSSLPGDLSKDPVVTRYKSVEELAKGHVEARKTISQGFRPPGADAKPEDVAKWRESIGVPKMPSDYEIAGDGLDAKLVENFRSFAHKAGMPAGLVKDLVPWFQQEQKQALDRTHQQWIAELDDKHRQWGEQLYNRKVTAGYRFVEAMSEEAGLDKAAVKQFLDASRMGDHPLLFQLLATAGERMIEDRIIDGDASSTADAKGRIQAIRADLKHPMNPVNHGGDQAKKREWDDLYKLAYGTKEGDGSFR